MHGWLNIDKPLGMSSAQVVSKIKWLLKPHKTKIGHAGTLDPLADGVLPIALGEATKASAYMMDAVKQYRFTLRFGEATNTDDTEGVVVNTSEVIPSKTALESVLPSFVGQISQVPPAFSALKVDGKRAYALARAGEEVKLEARTIRIDAIELLRFEGSDAEFLVTCGKGTYIRSLARDIAGVLGSCGHVLKLQRTQVGKFTLQDAISLDLLEKMVHNADSSDAIGVFEDVLMPVSIGLDDIPALHIDADQAATLRHGQSITITTKPECKNGLLQVQVGDDLVAVASLEEIGPTSCKIISKRIFNKVDKGDK